MSKAELTIYQNLKNWPITKEQIRELGINPDKLWMSIMLFELHSIALDLDVTIAELIEFS